MSTVYFIKTIFRKITTWHPTFQIQTPFTQNIMVNQYLTNRSYEYFVLHKNQFVLVYIQIRSVCIGVYLDQIRLIFKKKYLSHHFCCSDLIFHRRPSKFSVLIDKCQDYILYFMTLVQKFTPTCVKLRAKSADVFRV